MALRQVPESAPSSPSYSCKIFLKKMLLLCFWMFLAQEIHLIYNCLSCLEVIEYGGKIL